MHKINWQAMSKRVADLWQKATKRAADLWKKAIKRAKKLPLKKYLPHIKFSWGTLLYGVPIFFLLYYPLGAYLAEHIDTDTQVEIKKDNASESATINAMIYLIDKETSKHMWTPNMPIIFPGYILDNMPAFQTGEIKAAANVSADFAKVMQKYLPAEYDDLDKAAQYLDYSPTVWFFSEKAGKIFAPSSSTQYKKAKKELVELNQAAAENKFAYAYSAQDLDLILAGIYKDLLDLSETIRTHIKENSGNYTDFKADDVFYYGKGKIYGYYILLKALGEDYKAIIADAGMLERWTMLLDGLKDAFELNPWSVRNADMSSSFAPNHLAYLNMYVLSVAEQIKALDLVNREEISIDRDTADI